MHETKISYWTAAKKILRYLKATINHGLFLSNTSNFTIHAYADVDWAGCLNDRWSTGSFCIFLGNYLVSWSSRKQHTVAHSSTEAEYKSLANYTAELIWLQKSLKELGFLFLKLPYYGVITWSYLPYL